MSNNDKIKVSVVVVTFNEEKNIDRCLSSLSDFDEIIVVDSNSADKTKEISAKHGARVIDFIWNGVYPKKRQWMLDNVETSNDWVFFVDADEIVKKELVGEMKSIISNQIDSKVAGYFIKGLYEFQGKILKYGQVNNKLSLINRKYIEFPVIDDLDILGMGEIEGHYQPVIKDEYAGHGLSILQLNEYLVHHALEDEEKWVERHKRYAIWETGMNQKKAWPEDPVYIRRIMKNIFKKLPFRGLFIFIYSYFFKLGFLDGCAGFNFAVKRMYYYSLIG